MDKVERKRLAKFLDDHIPFQELKAVGFWPAGTRKTDYEVIAARICKQFGFKDIYEYDTLGTWREHPEANCINGSTKAKVDEHGNYHPAEGFHIDTCRSEFECPHCTCHQSVKDTPKVTFTQRCKGCKRPLHIFSCPMTGNLTVTEK